MNEEEEKNEIWKRNIPLFYKSFLGHILEWGSLTCQFLPEIKTTQDYIRQKIVLGTQTENNEKNYLYIAKLNLPNPTSHNLIQSNYKICDDQGSFLKPGINCLEFEVKINHPGDVYKARASYCSYNLIATKTNSGQVLIFDYTKHPFSPDDDEINAQMILQGHENEGWGLDWSLHNHTLLSSDDKGRVCYWDLEKSPLIENNLKSGKKSQIKLQSLHQYDYSNESINDIKFHKFFPQAFGFVQGQNVSLIDLRQGMQKYSLQFKANENETFCLDFSWDQEFLILTGSQDGQVRLWDIRNSSEDLYLFQNSGKPVLKVDWNQKKPGVFCVGGEDKQIKIYDCAKIGEKSGLFFIHPGCEGIINDFNWNPYNDLGLAVVDTENNIQIFEIDDKFYYNQVILIKLFFLLFILQKFYQYSYMFLKSC